MPRLLSFKDQEGRDFLHELLSQNNRIHVYDDYRNQLKELFFINNPKISRKEEKNNKFEEHCKDIGGDEGLKEEGVWVYYPWISSLCHILEDEKFQKVRTARNKNLISSKEQRNFYNSTVGIAGLSVGNSIALSIVLQGGAKRIKLADHDTLELTNLNRIRAGVNYLGVTKTEMTAKQIYLLNPYSEIEIFDDGLTEKNIDSFFEELDVVIDEIDDLSIKHLIRERARERRKPVIMAADNGDSGVVDIERYDLYPEQKFFHGRMGEVTYKSLKKLSKIETGKLITKHIGLENVGQRMQESLLEIGKSLVSWPQLGGTALLNGAAVAYCVRRILNDQKLEDNRSIISLDEKLGKGYNSQGKSA